jgi:hydrogenase nickel incorporation protein HypA/HybF
VCRGVEERDETTTARRDEDALMHEYSLALALIDRANREARIHGAVTVSRVVVRVGPLAGVERELLETAFGLVRVGTLCGSAELTVTGEDVVWRCDVCGQVLAPGGTLACPACGLPARLAGGDALVLERIEMEVPDHV